MFISFEGCEGSGKTTLILNLKNELKKLGYNVIITNEPGGSKLGHKIRELIIHHHMDAKTEALLFAANRFDHIEYLKQYNKDTIILCDRFIHSSYAYQGAARGLGIDYIKKINSFVDDFKIDLTFYIRVRPEVGLERIRANSRDTNRLDDESINFHKKVYDAYENMNDLIRINGEQDTNLVVNDCLNKIKEYMEVQNG